MFNGSTSRNFMELKLMRRVVRSGKLEMTIGQWRNENDNRGVGNQHKKAENDNWELGNLNKVEMGGTEIGKWKSS